jgi:multiple sugar transport system substrate-binding protein
VLGNDWLGIPVATIGGYLTYRKSAVDKAGFKEFPTDFPGFLELCKKLKANNTPAGFALGHATGDANAWLNWILWGHNAWTVDKDDKVIINSPETAKALEYCKALYDSFIPGTASWNDSSNNKAFLAGELYCTANGISIYVAAKTDASKKELAEDTYHALWPVGPVGKPTELQLALPILAFNFTKYPNAAKAFVAFMLEKENYEKWLDGAQGYLTQTLNGYESAPIWKADPKNEVFSQASKRTLPASGIGTVGEKAATAIADFIVVDMFANYCTGTKDAKGAMAEAERQLKRIYR